LRTQYDIDTDIMTKEVRGSHANKPTRTIKEEINRISAFFNAI